MLNDLVNLLGRKQPSVPALVSRLTTTPSTRSLPARTRRRRRRILRRRQRGVSRAPLQPPLELADPHLEPPVRVDQLANPHKHSDRRLPITVQNRLRLGPLHTTEFAPLKRVPSREVNAYTRYPICRDCLTT